MSQTDSKHELKVLLRPGTRKTLSILYEKVYIKYYPSFSYFIEDLLLQGLDAMERIE